MDYEIREKKLQDARRLRLMRIAAGKDDMKAMRAIDLLNKMDGLYLTRTQIGINTPPAPVLVSWQDEKEHPEIVEAAQNEGRLVIVDDIKE